MKLTLLLSLTFLLASCLPERLVPHDYSMEENNLEAFVSIDSVSIGIQNLEVKGDHYVFWMEVENKSEFPVSIDLRLLRKFAHLESYRGEHPLKLTQEVTTAMSKKEVNQFFKKKEQNAQAAAFLLLLAGAAITTYDMVKDVQDSRKEYWSEDDERRSAVRDLVTTTTQITTDLLSEASMTQAAHANQERFYLKKELFSNEVIMPGEKYGGKIMFRRFTEVKQHHRIICPLDQQEWYFDFRRATPKEKRYLLERGF